MLHNKHQGRAFPLPLRLNTCGRGLKGARARRSNPWNFQSDEFYHLLYQMQKKDTEERVGTLITGILVVSNTDLGMTPGGVKPLPTALAPNSVPATPALTFLHYPLFFLLWEFSCKIVPASPYAQLRRSIKSWRCCSRGNKPARIVPICPQRKGKFCSLCNILGEK